MSLSAARPGIRITDVRGLGSQLRPAPLAVGAITLGAFLLHVSQVHQSLYGDEVWSYQEVVHHSFTGMLAAVATGHAVASGESSPPLFFVFAWFSVKLGDPTVWIRLPSLILGAATIPIIYLLGRDTINRATGVVGAAVFAVSPFANYYGVEARPYATAAFFTVLSTYALVRAVRTDERRWWTLYAVAAVAAAYSHYTTVFVLLTQGAWSLWVCRNRWRRSLIANLGALVLYVPWLPYLHASAGLAGYALIEPLTTPHVLQDVVRLVVGYPYAPLHQIPTGPGVAAIALAAVLGGLVLVRRYLSDRARAADHLSRGGLLLIAALALATPIGLLLYSVLGTDIWGARSLYASAPAAALALGALLLAIPRGPRAVAVPVVLGVLVFGTVRAISPSWARPPYRVAAQYLDRVAGPRDPVVMYTWGFPLDQALPVQFRRPHVVIKGDPERWPTPPPGGNVYVVADDALPFLYGGPLSAVKLKTPHPPGLKLVASRRFSGLVRFSVLTYRPAGRA